MHSRKVLVTKKSRKSLQKSKRKNLITELRLRPVSHYVNEIMLEPNRIFTQNIISHNMNKNMPEANIVSQYAISNENLAAFKKLVTNNPSDCVISALQIIGVVDVFSSNIMRILIRGILLNTEQIEKIFILNSGNNFHFKSVSNYENFINIITTNLSPGNVLFCGVKNDKETSHVFLIGRHLDGNFVFIDPHENVNKYCDMTDPECYTLFSNKLDYFILYNSNEKLTIDQLKNKGFLL